MWRRGCSKLTEKESRKKAMDYEVPINYESLKTEQKEAEDDGDMETAVVLRRMKVSELKKLSEENARMDLDEAIETKRARLRDLKERNTGKKEPASQTQDNGEETNVGKELLQPETLKMLKDMKPKEREELLMSVSMVMQGTGGKGMGSILPFLMMARNQSGGGGGVMETIAAADKLLGFYMKGKTDATSEIAAAAPALPENITVAAPQKDGLAQWLDEEATNLMKTALTKALHPEPVAAAVAPEAGQPLDFPVKMIYDKERGEWYPSIVRNLDEYYKIEDRRQKRDKEAKDEKRGKEREDSVMKEVIKPLVKQGVELLKDAGEDLKVKLKKDKGAPAPTQQQPPAVKHQQQSPAPPAQPPNVQTMPCTSKACEGKVTVTAVDGKWPETAKCDTCGKDYAMKKGAQ